MLMNSGTSTHRQHAAVDPHQFRAQATGIGQTREASLATGRMRCMQVRAATPPAQQGKLYSLGYGQPVPGAMPVY